MRLAPIVWSLARVVSARPVSTCFHHGESTVGWSRAGERKTRLLHALTDTRDSPGESPRKELLRVPLQFFGPVDSSLWA